MGCSKNLVDSEHLITQLEANAFKVKHDDASDTETVIINTCGFIGDAKEESIDTILNMVKMKEEGHLKRVIVAGCLPERFKEELQAEIPEVDAWFGSEKFADILKFLDTPYRTDLVGERTLTTPSHYAYLKISEGCNRTCSFCAIPLMRGKHRSVPMEDLIQEAINLAKNGVKELILIAQELTYYGLDLYKKRMLPKLLRSLSEIGGIHWIRLHYAYPASFPIDLISVIRDNPKVCNYLDLPLQHINDRILKSMHRKLTGKEQQQLLENIREIHPGIAVRSTLITGYPGETENEFEEMLEFVRNYQFDRLGVFPYSHEEDTSAFKLEDDVPLEVKMERARRLMEMQEDISFEKNVAKIGSKLEVIIDNVSDNTAFGRTEFDSPEVDNEVIIDISRHKVNPGDIIQVEITGADVFELSGKCC